MADTTESSSIPCPRLCSSVKSAALQAFSLARWAVFHCRGLGGRQRQPALRLKAENERLQQEVSLLREELDKDAALEQVRAHCRRTLPCRPTAWRSRLRRRPRLVARPGRQGDARDRGHRRVVGQTP